MNPTTSFSKAPETNEVCAARDAHHTPTRRGPRRVRGLLTAAALFALCVSMAGCDGGSSSNSAGNSASGSSTAANDAAAGAGGASAPVPIVAAPASGACASLGASAAQPLQNTQLVCAP
ncbi:hypothetical protein [Paraburkholderia caffeinilytica]|uniref:hypothetical protein n=1 Tax=Paraburkholderia caffeinilytica TaxID=1761016 RepID=UPI0038B849BA